MRMTKLGRAVFVWEVSVLPVLPISSMEHGGGGRGGVFRHCYELSEPELQLLAVRIVTATGWL